MTVMWLNNYNIKIMAVMGNSSVTNVTFREKCDDNIVINSLKSICQMSSCFYPEEEQLHCEKKL